MASPNEGVYIVNLKEFRAALKAADSKAPRQLTKALRAAGKPAVLRAKELAPMGSRKGDKHPGQLREGYKVSAAGNAGRIVNPVPYAAGAEWGLHGKWKGFLKYPGAADDPRRGRFAWRAVLEEEQEIQQIMYDELIEIFTAMGWAT